MLLETLIQTCSIWYFHVKLSSMKIAKNFVMLSLGISKLLIWSMGKSFAIRRFFFYEWKSSHFVLIEFRESLYALNQIDSFSSSTFTSSNSLLISLLDRTSYNHLQTWLVLKLKKSDRDHWYKLEIVMVLE